MGVNIIEKDGKEYINEEKVIYKYKCAERSIIFIRIALFILMLTFYFYQLKEFEIFNFDWIILSIICLIIPIWLILKDMKNFYHVGFYLTNKHLITFSGKKVKLSSLYFKRGSGAIGWGRIALSIYENNGFIIYCIEEDNDEFNKLLDSFYHSTNNEKFKINSTTLKHNFFDVELYIKQKFINKET